MKKLIKLHLGVFQYLWNELNSKKSPSVKAKTFYMTLKNYGKYFINAYKLVLANLDSDYRTSKQEYKKRLKIYKRFNEVISALTWIETELHRNGLSRRQFRQFFHDFHKYPDKRKEIVDTLLKTYQINP